MTSKTTTYKTINPRYVYQADIRRTVIKHDVLAVEGESDWTVGAIMHLPGDTFFADTDHGGYHVDTMADALAMFES